MRGAVVEEQRTPGRADRDMGDPSPAYVLRGVSGLVFGRTFAIDQPVTVGRLPVCDITLQEATLSRCHVRLKAARRQSLQTNSSRAMQAALNALQGQPINDWKNYDARIDAITIADLAEFAGRRLTRAQRTQLVVRP